MCWVVCAGLGSCEEGGGDVVDTERIEECGREGLLKETWRFAMGTARRRGVVDESEAWV